MTTQQYRRMCVFALRMVPTAIAGSRSRSRLHRDVREILARLADPAFSCAYRYIRDWDSVELKAPEERSAPGDLYKCALLCDFVTEYCWDHGLAYKTDGRDSKLAVGLACCIRAACDVAVAPSGGVLGWTIQDLRDMWPPKPVPKWVKAFFDAPFDTFAGSQPVWL